MAETRKKSSSAKMLASKKSVTSKKRKPSPLKKATVKTTPKKASSAAAPQKKPASKKTPAKRSSRPKLTKAKIYNVFERFSEDKPDPQGELEYVNVFTLLVAVVLSAQATDAGVNKATRALFKVADTPKKMLALGEDKVRDYIKTIGLYRNKAKNVILLCQKLINEFNSEVPEDRDALETLPGVGRKTANVVLNVYFDHPTMAVDTHVFRLANRIGLSSGKTPLAVEEDLLRVVPEEFGVPAHHWLILHGRYVCKARKPDCPNCVINDLCTFKDKTPNTADKKQK